MVDLSDIKLYYRDAPGRAPSMGRGEFINLLLKDSGLEYEYVRFEKEEFIADKPRLISKGLVQPTMPYLVANGKYYGKTYPILRFLVKKIGKYGGKNDDEAQLVDALADSIADWYTKWIQAILSAQKDAAKTFHEETHPSLIKEFDDYLAKSNGPYLLGEEVSYADFMLYHVLDDCKGTGGPSLDGYPSINKFYQAIESRPNLKDYLASSKK